MGVTRLGSSTTIRVLAVFFWLAVLAGQGGRLWAETGTNLDKDEKVTIDFNNVDLTVFIKFISEVTGKNVVVDQRVAGKVTVFSPTQISVGAAWRVFLSVLDVHGYGTVETGDVIKIVPMLEARTMSVETRLKQEAAKPGDRVMTRLIPLDFADADEVRRLLTPLISKSSLILSYAPTNTLIVTDISSNIDRLVRILEVVDVAGADRELAVIPLLYADSVETVAILNAVFREGQKVRKEDPESIPRFVADERTNSIVALASPQDLEKTRALLENLDVKTPKGGENVQVVYLENAVAEDLALVLSELPGKEEGGQKRRPGAPVVSQEVAITADKATNSLIIRASRDDFAVLEQIIQKLDIPRSMVFIECLIMEVNVNKAFELGTEWIVMGETTYNDTSGGIGGGFGGNSNYSNIQGVITPNAAGAGALPAGFSLGLFTEAVNIGGVLFPNLSAIISAYQKDEDVHILSTPQVLTTDHEEASISVGKNIPYLTKSGSSEIEAYNTYEYRDVGITLKITPHITRERLVRLKISQEVSKLDELSTNDSATPVTLKRTIDTSVIVKDNATVVIGGLIDDSLTVTENRVPCLGDIPLLEYLFKARSRSRDKTNLYVFLTPRVIENPAEAQAVLETKQKEMEELGKPASKEETEKDE